MMRGYFKDNILLVSWCAKSGPRGHGNNRLKITFATLARSKNRFQIIITRIRSLTSYYLATIRYVPWEGLPFDTSENEYGVSYKSIFVEDR